MRNSHRSARRSKSFRGLAPCALTAASILLLALACAASAVAQPVRSRHADVWPFGTGCRITWSADAASLSFTTDPVIFTYEGSAVFTDPATGALELYSDGVRVWDASGVELVSNLPGDASSMHSAVIVPAPGAADEVIVFAHGANPSSSVSYRRFDISGVATPIGGSNTSVSLGASAGREGMIAVPHANGVDWWVLVSGATSIFVIPVTSTGVGAASAVASGLSVWTNGWHVFAASPDGGRVVMSGNSAVNVTSAGDMALWDFDTATGMLSNRVLINESFRRHQLYGGAFSPDGSKLYFVTLDESGASSGPSSVYQYDLATQAFTQVATNALRYYFGDARLGPDGRVYVAGSNGAGLHVIEAPNEPGALATVMVDALLPPMGCGVELGLPQIVSPLVRFTGSLDGAACAMSTDCRSGYCVDGVCCDGSCGGGLSSDCQACAEAAGATQDGRCGPVAALTPCRGVAGVCDVAETCDGLTLACPADAFAVDSVVCRDAVDLCDVAELCMGDAAECPDDLLAADDVVCRGVSDLCDVAELCPGDSAQCPGDAFAASDVECRGAANLCDAAEFCLGDSAACPTDAPALDGTPCGAAAVCTEAPVCAGGVCGTPAAIDCDDGDMCTLDSCDDVSGCVYDPSPACVMDAGVPDAGVTDAGVEDAGPLDAGALDAGGDDLGMVIVDAGDLDDGSLPDASDDAAVDDGSTGGDAASGDAATVDAGDDPSPSSGCSCRVQAHTERHSAGLALVFALGGLAVARRLRRRR